MKIYTKEELILALKEIRDKGWVPNARHGNVGGVGNTLEDLLGITENNLPIPNAVEWELKTQRDDTSSLITLFHSEPSPSALRFVPQVFLPKYGWSHKGAGTLHSSNEMSFRQTIQGKSRSDRGFKVVVDRGARKILISFDFAHVDQKHSEWLKFVKKMVGLTELNPQPYWGFDDLCYKAGTKLKNCFYVRALRRTEKKREFFHYAKIAILEEFNFEKLLTGLEEGFVFVDFDARTGHNHGTKFRTLQGNFPLLYSKVIEV